MSSVKPLPITLHKGGSPIPALKERGFTNRAYNFGIDGSFLKKQGPFVVPHHIDWSERHHHLAGAFGAALARHLVDLEWLKHVPASRAMRVTESGRKALKEEFGLCLD